MTNDRERTGDWDRTDWVGEGQGTPEGRSTPDDVRTLTSDERIAGETTGTIRTGDRWNKTQWVGDQGEGAPAPEDPDLMPEGESGLSGDRHTPGEQRWSQGQERDLRDPARDSPLGRS
jgi:hypothetical protein